MRISPLPFDAAPLTGQRALLWSPRAGACLVDRQLVPALLRCAGGRTIDDHCAEAIGRGDLRPEHAPDLHAQLSRLADRGFFVSEGQLPPSTPGVSPAAPTRIKELALITRDRPESARRSLASYLENSAGAGRDDCFTVCDDSTGEQAASNQRQAHQLGVRHGLEVRYLGVADRQRYLPILARQAGLSLDVARSALVDVEQVGFARGANTNAFLLETAGRPCFCFDDDSLCRPARPVRDDQVSLSGAAFPVRLRAFSDRAQLDSMVQVADDVCLLAQHERWLGARAGQIAAGVAPLAAGGAPALLASLMQGRAQVLVSWSGLYGDSGSAYSTYYLGLTGADRDRLLATEHHYREAIAGRTVWKAPDQVQLSRSDLFQSVAFAADNRELLPPFMPFLRASDTLFGQMLLRLFDDGLIACLPWSVDHLPDAPRRQAPEDIWRRAGELRFAGLVDLAMRALPPSPAHSSPEQRLDALGGHLVQLGSLTPGGLHELLFPHLARGLARAIARLDGLLRAHQGQPAFWARDVRRTIEIYERRLLSTTPLLPDEPALQGRDRPAAEAAQRLLLRLGQVLQAWPALRSAAERLRQQGITLSRSLWRPRPAGPSRRPRPSVDANPPGGE